MLSCYPLSSGTRTGNRISKRGERDGRPDQALVLIDRDSLCADLVESRANRKYLENGGLVPTNAAAVTDNRRRAGGIVKTCGLACYDEVARSVA